MSDNIVSTEVANLKNTNRTEDSDQEDKSAAFPFDTEEQRTVFSDPVSYNVKHPLFNSWTLWFDNPGKKTNAASWSQTLKELITFDSVEEFWGVYNNIVKASDLTSGSNYHLFKRGIKPMWEDPVNEHGGKWLVQFSRHKTGDDINMLWLYTMLACIGEAFEHADEICGAVVSVRKIFYRISLWMRSSNNREIAETVGRQLKATLNLSNLPLEFHSHADASKNGSHSKDRKGGDWFLTCKFGRLWFADEIQKFYNVGIKSPLRFRRGNWIS